MKKILFLFLCFSCCLLGGVPESISFQSIVRDANGDLLKESTVGVTIDIIVDSPEGDVVYTEVHDLETNVNGLLSLNIGEGSNSAEFGSIDWGYGQHFVKIDVAMNGSQEHVLTNTSQLLSVPYALHAKIAEGINADELKIDYETLTLGDSVVPNVYVNEDNQILFFTKEADSTRTDLRKDIQLAPNVRLWGYSSEYLLDNSGVINLQAIDSLSKPAIVWYNPEGERKAAIVGHEYSGGHNNRHNHWSIETSTEDGELFTRMEFPFDSSTICIETHSSDFKVGDGGKFLTTGPVYSYNTSKVGFGDKEWEDESLYGNAKWEFYRGETTAELLVHQNSGEKEATISLKRGSDIWNLTNEGDFTIDRGSNTRLTMTPAGDVGIGVTAPEHRLEVDGDVNVTVGHAYLTSGADYAEYFQCEGQLEVGDVVGINLDNGLVGKYEAGYVLIGIVSDNAGFIGNNAKGRKHDDAYVLVGVKGQLPVNSSQVVVRERKVYSKDDILIGILLANDKVYLTIDN